MFKKMFSLKCDEMCDENKKVSRITQMYID